MKKISLAIMLVLIVFSIKAQKLTYVGFEGGPKWDYHQLTDYGDGLVNIPTSGAMFGFTVGHEILPNMFIETGFHYSQLWESVRFKVMPYGNGSTSGMVLYKVPLKFKYRYPVFRDRLFLTGSLGFVGAYNESFSGTESGGSSSISSVSDSVFEQSIHAYTSDKFLSFIEAGLSIDYKFKNNITVSLVNNYTLGFKQIIFSNITYRVNDGEEQKAENTSKGSSANVLLSVKIPISNIWDKSEENIIRKEKIKGGLEKNKEKRFYISADAGVCKPYLTGDSPNIKGNDNISLLGSNNTFAGINFGAKIYNNWIVEAGFYGNEFMNMYYIYKDGFAVSGSGFSGSGYITIPLKVKYDYNFLNNRMSLMPNIGTAVLFSNVEGMYSSSISTGKTMIDGIVTNNIEEFAYAYRENGAKMIITAGLGLEFALTDRLILMLNSSYGKGFKDFNRLNVDYNSDLFSEEGNVFFQGTNFNFLAGIKVPLDFKRKEK